MRVIHDPAEFSRACDALRAGGKRVGLVPTMGALHPGHVALVREAQRHSDAVAVSVFVNPTQFGPNEDYARYPRTLDADVAACEAQGAAIVFAPERAAMYPTGHATIVEVDGVTAPLEGAHRPGHFRGVTTIVAKLFALTGRATAVFGRKDYQQWRVISRMTRDLGFPVEIIGMPTVRESDGLAMSSRNRYLSDDERVRALGIVRGIRRAHALHAQGERDAAVLARAARDEVEASFDSIDYVAVADADTLAPIARVEDRAVLAFAARIGKTRLIDNIVLGEECAP